MKQYGLSAVVDDDALETLLLPLSSGMIRWPAQSDALFLRARVGVPLFAAPRERLLCEQSFKPRNDELHRAGFRVGNAAETGYDLVLLLPPRQRFEARALLARALQHARDGGIVVASLANNAGARSGETDLARLAGNVHSLSKHKCRVFWTSKDVLAVDDALIGEWAALDAPRPIDDGRYLSRPGLFAWDRIDAASALLAGCLPRDLAGRGADLGAGYGYLADQVLQCCPAVSTLHLYEAESRALDLARINLLRHAESVSLDYFWHDVTSGLPQRYDFIVMNPPFHEGRADRPGLGRDFIAAAADALLPDGRLLLVANRHLPYEEALMRRFQKVDKLADAQGFKVLLAIRGKS